jgi:hypothetical protein
MASKKVLVSACRKTIDSVTASIQGPELKTVFFNNAMIAGGAINSLYMGNKVNDWDIYLKSPQECEPLIQYWLRDQNLTTEVLDGRIRVNFDGGNPLHYFIKKLPYNTEVDNHQPKAVTNNAISLQGNVQIVIRFMGQPSTVTESFDFEHAKIVYEHNTGKIYSSRECLESMLFKRLLYTGSHYPIASMFRMRKFIKRGWEISAGQMAKIAFQINSLDLSDKEVLYEQLIGVDMLYMSAFLAALEKQAGEVTLDSCYVSELLDELFDVASQQETEDFEDVPF